MYPKSTLHAEGLEQPLVGGWCWCMVDDTLTEYSCSVGNLFMMIELRLSHQPVRPSFPTLQKAAARR